MGRARCGLAVFVLAAAALAPAQERPAQLPTFGATAEAITVDVVVLDRDGRPVTDLRRDEFTLSEDGRPQEIVAFEARALAAGVNRVIKKPYRMSEIAEILSGFFTHA